MSEITDSNFEKASVRDTAFRVRMRRFFGVLQRLTSNPTTVVGLVLIALMLAMAIFAPWITEANTPDAYQMPRKGPSDASQMSPTNPGP